MRQFVFAIGFLLLALTGHARAENTSPSHLGAIAPFNWTGFYGGIYGGYGSVDSRTTFSGNGAAASRYNIDDAARGSISNNVKSAFGGIQGGYNFQSGQFVYGGEADFGYGHFASSGALSWPASLTDLVVNVPGFYTITRTYQYETTASQTLDWIGTVRGRLGYLPVNQLLVYATGGLAYGHATLSSRITQKAGTQDGTSPVPGGSYSDPLASCFDVCATASSSRWLVGWTMGGGVEYALAEYWKVKLEYFYYDLGTLTVSSTDPKFPAYIFRAKGDFNGQIARIGLVYYFQ